MLCIFLNCVAIGIYDHSLQNKEWNRMIESINKGFTAIYVVEAVIKIIAYGFVMASDTYLRDPTNIFDFLIIVFALVQLIVKRLIDLSNGASSFFRIVRTLRVLKLLAGFQKVP